MVLSKLYQSFNVITDISQFQGVLRDVYGKAAQVDDIMKRWGMKFLNLCVVEATAQGTNKPKSTVRCVS
jgi:hypothetical protein